MDGNNFSFYGGEEESPKLSMNVAPQAMPESKGSSLTSFLGMAGANPYVAGATAGLSVLSKMSSEKKKAELQRKTDRMAALQNYMNIAQQMGQGL